MVYVYDTPTWEYKVVTAEASSGALPEEDLNALGKDGWELTGVATADGKQQFCFKRRRP
jgi:hypothetical protein